MLKIGFTFLFLLLGFVVILFNKRISLYFFNEAVKSRIFIYNFFNARENVMIAGTLLIIFGFVFLLI